MQNVHIWARESAAELFERSGQGSIWQPNYPRIAKDYFYNKKHQTVEIIKLNGSIELAPIVGLSEVICDIVETGTTLRENRLSGIEEVCPLYTLLHSRCLCCNGSRGGSAHPLPEACGAGSHFRHDGYKNDTPPCGNLAFCGHGAVARRCNPGWSVWRCNE